MIPKPESKNRLVLTSFINYCAAHPEERFWQALRNWAGASFILYVPPDRWRNTDFGKSSEFVGRDVDIYEFDTFYWEGHRG